jgi:hypothetical protein
MTRNHAIPAEDVLRAFAMDFEPGAGVLQRYLAKYPEYASRWSIFSENFLVRLTPTIRQAPRKVALVSSRMERLRESSVSLEALQAAPANLHTGVRCTCPAVASWSCIPPELSD